MPADIRLVTANVMKVEEAALTGESVPVNKTSDVLDEDDLALGDRDNMVYMTANITTGRGTGIVVATGMQTEVGQIAGMIETKETKTHYKKT